MLFALWTVKALEPAPDKAGWRPIGVPDGATVWWRRRQKGPATTRWAQGVRLILSQ